MLCALLKNYYETFTNTSAPLAIECVAAIQYGRQKVDATTLRLYICAASGWKSTVLQ